MMVLTLLPQFLYEYTIPNSSVSHHVRHLYLINKKCAVLAVPVILYPRYPLVLCKGEPKTLITTRFTNVFIHC